MSWSKPPAVGSPYYCVLELLEGRPTCLVLGHSFVRRMHRSIQREIDYLGLRAPIAGQYISEGRLVAYLMNLSQLFREVHLRYTPLIRQDASVAPHDVESELLAANIIRPQILVLVLGSNDLVRNMDSETMPEDLALELVDLAERFRSEAGVSQVVITSALNRSVGPLDFAARMRSFNSTLEALCQYRNGIAYYRIRGFSETPDSRTLSVSVWSRDGIHPSDTTKYFRKFGLEIRGAILSAIPALAEALAAGALPSPPPTHNIFNNQPPPPPPGAPAIAV